MRPEAPSLFSQCHFTAAAPYIEDCHDHSGQRTACRSAIAERGFFKPAENAAVPAKAGPHFCQESLAVDGFTDGTGSHGTDGDPRQLPFPAFHGRKGRLHPCRRQVVCFIDIFSQPRRRQFFRRKNPRTRDFLPARHEAQGVGADIDDCILLILHSCSFPISSIPTAGSLKRPWGKRKKALSSCDSTPFLPSAIQYLLNQHGVHRGRRVSIPYCVLNPSGVHRFP